MIKQEEPSTFECTICKNFYSSKLNLKRHIKNVHTYNKIKCTVCDVEMTRKSYQRHLKKIHGFNQPKSENNDENENKCEEMKDDEEDEKGTEATSEDKPMEPSGDQESINPCEVLCKVEMNESTGQGEGNVNLCFQGVECKICNQTYSNELNLKKHVYNVHRMVRVKCHICDKEVNKKSLDRHMKSVHSAKVAVKKERKLIPDEEKIPCMMCGKKCLNLASLQNHIKNIHEAEQFKCTQCDFQGIKRHLDKHIKKQHSEEVFQCTRCQKILKSKSTLKEHMWIHTDHRRFICDICGMRFKRTSNYHGHMKSHQDKKFQCQLCGNFFLRKRYLAVHEQTIHNYYGEGVPPQEKGYQCEVCGVKLKWKNNLLAHMRIHTGEKPYKCKICEENFTCHGSLRTHMAKHGEFFNCKNFSQNVEGSRIF